jgi:hypothetical protein
MSEETEQIVQLDDRIEEAVARNEGLIQSWRASVGEAADSPHILDELLEVAIEIGKARDGLRSVRSEVASLAGEIERRERADNFTFSDEDVLTALSDERQTAWDVVTYLRRRAGLTPGPVTPSLQSRACWALRRLASAGLVEQERVVVYGRRCASIWRRI